MRLEHKIRLFFGWFGVLTPVYAAGALTVLLTAGFDNIAFIVRAVVISAVNCFIGYKILKIKIAEKGAKEDGNPTRS